MIVSKKYVFQNSGIYYLYCNPYTKFIFKKMNATVRYNFFRDLDFTQE